MNQFPTNVLDDVRRERVRQDRKYGGQEHDRLHTDGEWRGLINNRLSDLIRHIPEKRRQLWIEIAALAVAAVEAHE